MLLARTVEDIEAKDFFDNERRLGGAIDSTVCELIRGEALSVERAEARFVTKERPAGHGHAACEKGFDRSVEPDDRNALAAKKLWGALLSISAAAQREHDG